MSNKRAAYPEFMAEASDGHYARDVSLALSELIDDLREQASAQSKTVSGDLTIKQRFALNERGEVDFSYDVAVKKPKRPRVKGRHYITKDGELTSVHPRQLSITDALNNASRAPARAEERTPKHERTAERRPRAAVVEVPEADLSMDENEEG